VRLVDDKYRLFGLINPIDLAVLLVVALGVVIGARVLLGSGTTAVIEDKKPVSMVIVAKNVAAFDISVLKAGDPVRKKDGKPIGKLVSAEASASVIDTPDFKGGIAAGVSPTLKDVRIVVEGEGTQTSEGVMIDGSRLRTNMEIEVATPSFEAKGRVSELTIGK